MSDLARYLSGDNYLTRSASGIKRGLSALADSLMSRSNEGIENMNAALSGVRVLPGAILTDAGYVMPDASGQPDFSQVGLEREPDTLRLLELFGSAMAPVKGATVAAKSGAGGKVAADVASSRAAAMETARENAVKMLGLPENNTAMDRALSLGYDTPAYHGTAGDIKGASFDPGKSRDVGIHFSVSPEVSSGFAEGGAVYPVLIKGADDFPRIPDIFSSGDYEHAANSLAPYLRYSMADDAASLAAKGLSSRDGSHPAAKNFWRDVRAGIDDDWSTGRPYNFVYDNAFEGGGNAFSINDMSLVRSPFAAFDPARADSADLLASRANLGPIVNALLQGYDRR